MQDPDRQFRDLLNRAASAGASDLVLVADTPPAVLIDGAWTHLDAPPLAAAQLEIMLLAAIDPRHRAILNAELDVDLALDDPNFGRCRVNLHRQKRSLAAAVRFVARAIPAIETLNLPEKVIELADLPRGLVLVTGGTGTGKSTTIAAMIDRINHTRRAHVITLEDPIEYVFENDQCVIEQREIGVDAPSFASALRHVVRQIPDIIMIGEMRDLETIATALTAVETGHLVIASLHTINAAQTIERVVDVFEPSQQHFVRTQLANTLQAVICQTLFTNQRDGGRIPAVEVLVRTPAVTRAIRDNQIHLIPGMIETGRQFGMCTLDAAIADCVFEGQISPEAALAKAVDPAQLERKLGRTPVLDTRVKESRRTEACSP